MSGIYGIFNFDGAPADPSFLANMRKAIAHYGPDGSGETCIGPAGLGYLLLHTTPQDRFEQQPLTADGLTLVAAGRLDNREDLYGDCGISASEQATTPDSLLFLRAYQRWGEDCPAHLLGDWHFAVWDSRRRALFIARDRCGNTGLYYYRNAGFLVFASNLKALIALPQVPRRPNLLRVAQILTVWPGDGIQTAYEGLVRLPPAHTLRLTETDAEMRRYWYPECLSPLKLASDDDYVEEFLLIYQQAVRCCLHTHRPVGVTLSGGLDSGSVAALAAPMMAQEGKRLTAFTSVPLFDAREVSGNKRTGDEWAHAHATARQAGNIEHLLLTARDVSLVEGIQRFLELYQEPGHAAANFYWIMAILAEAKRRGMGVLLTGQNGNATVTWSGTGSFFDLISREGWRAAVCDLLLTEADFWQTLKRQFLKPLLLPAIRLFRYYKNGTRLPWHDYAAIHPHFAQRLQLENRMREAGHDATFTTPSAERLVKFRSCMTSGGAIWHALGAGYNLDVRDPTQDARLIEFCLRLPNNQFHRRGEDRRLIRRAMADRMPHDVLHNRRRGLQAADIGYRVVEQHEEIGAVLDRMEQSPLVRECLDLPRMRNVLTTLQSHIDAAITAQCGSILLRGLSVGLFLERF